MIIDRDGMLRPRTAPARAATCRTSPRAGAFFIDPRDAKFGANGKYYKRDLTEAKKLWMRLAHLA